MNDKSQLGRPFGKQVHTMGPAIDAIYERLTGIKLTSVTAQVLPEPETCAWCEERDSMEGEVVCAECQPEAIEVFSWDIPKRKQTKWKNLSAGHKRVVIASLNRGLR